MFNSYYLLFCDISLSNKYHNYLLNLYKKCGRNLCAKKFSMHEYCPHCVQCFKNNEYLFYHIRTGLSGPRIGQHRWLRKDKGIEDFSSVSVGAGDMVHLQEGASFRGEKSFILLSLSIAGRVLRVYAQVALMSEGFWFEEVCIEISV